ncbi:hypothetical protein B0H19DRAFT_1092107 [Mycena capillaripes]|nr:hypothetical protein B0H19DRAFT_1092107 [Mycena capillaripes]
MSHAQLRPSSSPLTMPDDSVAPRSPSPSPEPPSPHEEDLAGARRWDDDDEAEHLDPSSKSKGKAREVYPDKDDPEYPPVTDEDAETRRIEENLKRWEVAERMKRKAARESSTDVQPPSLLRNVSWRASSLWSGRNSQNPHNINTSLGAHTALNSEDTVDVVPLADIAATPTPSPTHSESSNPFTNPQAPDPFSDAEAVMSPSADPPPPTPQMEKDDAIALSPQRPALLAASSSMSIRRPPTPKPLGLPPPRAPPPPLPQNSPPPIPVPTDEEPKTRWWHEWLCGFGEGPDRGGDHQAGRTNPFE